ncbi:MAG: hypothetical protein P4L53_24550 [Candidatus Obscuribacterales bacterium]|nr:hypothetical protein [Candidatus Obscuribacterales bacterium]
MIDSLNGQWTKAEISAACGQKLGVANHHNWNVVPVEPKTNTFWGAGISDDEKRIIVDWSSDQCAISRDSLKVCFGDGKFIPARMDGCLGYPPWLVFERPWGRIVCMMGESPYKKEGLVESVSFEKKPQKP